ncbi:heme-dependent oxidative N-demethylase family protein [Pseudooceanicola sp. C21-150M6]|uniref:heme-dependent oxidative N-demethylase family protein n=1 Tax=Pseudooceanicola sp. C21-150M6 TaxID=3434355 RepID=UPI003D7F2BB6
MQPILQSHIPYDTTELRLPGTRPLGTENWLLRDDAFAAQMALRDRLIAQSRERVIGLLPEGQAAALELLDTVLRHLGADAGYIVLAEAVRRPDGVMVTLDRSDPLGTLGRLVQSDFCLLEKTEGQAEHVLTGAVLCFPAGWTLAEKLGRPLIRIHKPVPAYDETLAKRVQRLFDGVQVGRPLWRFNHLGYVDPALFQPRREGENKYGAKREHRYIRSERQTMLRLPETGAVVFGIHTFVVAKP